jgi:hypothetical protein
MKKAILSLFLFGAILSAAPVGVTMVDAGNPIKSVGGEDVGPYDLSINGVTVQAMCMDDFLTSKVGGRWNANETAVSGNSFSNTYLGQSKAGNDIGWSSFTDKQMYTLEAYLFNELVQPNANRGNIQQAAWDVMDSNSYWGDYSNSGVMAVLNDALKNYSAFDATGYEIVTDVNGNGYNSGNQEFMIHPDPSSATPEPATFALMGGGLFAASALRLFRRKKQAEVKA